MTFDQDAPVTHQDQGVCECSTRPPLANIVRPRKPSVPECLQLRCITDLWLLRCQSANPYVAGSRGVLHHLRNTGGRLARPIRPWWFYQPQTRALSESAEASCKRARLIEGHALAHHAVGARSLLDLVKVSRRLTVSLRRRQEAQSVRITSGFRLRKL